jgi:hypothetical protein
VVGGGTFEAIRLWVAIGDRGDFDRNPERHTCGGQRRGTLNLRGGEADRGDAAIKGEFDPGGGEANERQGAEEE